MKPLFTILALAAAALTNVGCLEAPVSLSDLKYETSDAKKEIADFSNDVVLENILRSKEYAPLSYSDFSSVTASASTQETVDYTIPFGPLHGSNTRDSFAPGVQATASPTATVSSLNEQGFVLAMMQPINPQYIANKWSESYNSQLLLFLFVKSIQFANQDKIVNDPDDPVAYRQFAALVHEMGRKHVTIHTLTVMEPIGSPLSSGSTSSSTTYTQGISTPPDNNQLVTNNNDTTALTLEQSFGEGQLHLGNVDCDGPCPTPTCPPMVSCYLEQVYREYPLQTVLCSTVPKLTVNGVDYDIYDADTVGQITAGNFDRYDIQTAGARATLSAILPTTAFAASKSASSGTGTPSPATSTTPATPASSSSTSSVLATNRIGALIYGDSCKEDELVEQRESEEDFAASTARYTRIEWRSVSEVIDYLGALARNRITVSLGSGELNPYFFLIRPVVGHHKGEYVLRTTYRGQSFGVGDVEDLANGSDDVLSLQALRLVRELVDSSKVSSGTAVTQPILFVP